MWLAFKFNFLDFLRRYPAAFERTVGGLLNNFNFNNFPSFRRLNPNDLDVVNKPLKILLIRNGGLLEILFLRSYLQSQGFALPRFTLLRKYNFFLFAWPTLMDLFKQILRQMGLIRVSPLQNKAITFGARSWPKYKRILQTELFVSNLMQESNPTPAHLNDSEQLHAYLIKQLAQHHPQQEFQFYPVLFQWDRSVLDRPTDWWSFIKSTGGYNPPFWIKYLRLVYKRSRIIFECLDPISIKGQDLLAQSEEFIPKLLDHVQTTCSQARLVLNGPAYRKPRMVLNAILNDPEQKIEVAQAPLAQKAHILNNMIADFHFGMIEVLRDVLGFFWNRIFNGIHYSLEGIQQLRDLAKTHTLVFIPSHRSHTDYFILSWVLFKNNMTPPHIAAGENLNLPVFGKMLRRAGAFFIKRQFAGNKVYEGLLKNYLKYLTLNGYSQGFFIEGGRSRTGKLLAPKLGMLNMYYDIGNQFKLPIAFIPVSFQYEKVVELGSYQKEEQGGKKRKESLWQVFKLLNLLKKRFGAVFLNFGTALVPQWQETHNGVEPNLKEIGFEINRRIALSAQVHQSSLILLLFQMSKSEQLNEQEIVDSAYFLRVFLEKTSCAPGGYALASEEYSHHLLITKIKQLVQIGFLEQLPPSNKNASLTNPTYQLNTAQLFSVHYHQNSLLYPFLSLALYEAYKIHQYWLSETSFAEFVHTLQTVMLREWGNFSLDCLSHDSDYYEESLQLFYRKQPLKIRLATLIHNDLWVYAKVLQTKAQAEYADLDEAALLLHLYQLRKIKNGHKWSAEHFCKTTFKNAVKTSGQLGPTHSAISLLNTLCSE